MVWLAAALIGSSLLSGAQQSRAGRRASQATQQAATLANRQAQQAQQRAEQLTQPYRTAGNNASTAQQALLGIGGSGGGGSGLNANGQVVGSQDWGAYLDANQDVRQYFLSNPRALEQFGGDINAAAEYHYNTFGRSEGRQLPTVAGPAPPTGADGQPLTQTQVTDNAYNAFLNSGYNRSMTEFTNNDLDQIRASSGAAGSSISGSAVGAMGDRLARNRANAFSAYTGDLMGLSNTGANVAQNTGNQILNTAQTTNQNNMGAANARGSSYQNTANAFSSALQGVTDVAAYGAGNGWFGERGTITGSGIRGRSPATPAGTYNGINFRRTMGR
jgi:hypothetical protein